MSQQEQDPMVAFEQSRVADLVAFYNDMAALSKAPTLDKLLQHSDALRKRISELRPTMISNEEAQTFEWLLLSMTNSCRKALGFV